MHGIERLDETRAEIDCGHGVKALLFANELVDIDRASIEDIRSFAGTAETIRQLVQAGVLPPDAAIDRVVLTPDFHRGSAMPVGTVARTTGLVLPRAVGSDIGCGMSLAMLDIEAEEVAAMGRELDTALRRTFFEGGRDIRLDAETREALLDGGVAAMAECTTGGLFETLPIEARRGMAGRMHGGGRIAGARFGDSFVEWIRPGGRKGETRDSFLGTIGGGNHFVEVQRVDAPVDRGMARQWGVRSGKAAIMVHSGSLSLGKAVSIRHLDAATRHFPRSHKRPDNGTLPLAIGPAGEGAGDGYLAEMAAAANFATANRLALSLMAARTIAMIAGREIGWHMVHDLPHNLAWREGDTVLHRKGACPATIEPDDPNFPLGHPVIIPGSMGSESWLLRSLGSDESLRSAPHGAGRVLSRNAGRAASGSEPELRIITRIDLERARPDVLRELNRDLAEEAPRVYKDIGPVIDTVEAAFIAARVARLTPILTIKG